jgi:hypothetical protein
MRPDGCYDLDELLDAADAQASDPRRVHLASCARCRANLSAYRRFLDPGGLPADAEPEDARETLFGFLDERVAAGGRPAGMPARRECRTHRPWFFWPVLTGAGAALVAVIMIGISLRGAEESGLGAGAHPPSATRPSSATASPRTITLRDGSAVTAHVEAQATVPAEGGMRWTWQAVDGADGYAVLIYDDDLTVIERISADGALQAELSAAALALLEGASLWQVLALHGGDEIARSGPQYLPSE